MPDKYMRLESGRLVQTEATDQSAGAGNAGEVVALNAQGEIDQSMLPDVEVVAVEVSENLADGDYVNLWDDTGTLKARKADGSGGIGKKADGYVEAAYTTGQIANIFKDGVNHAVSRTVVGAPIYLSTTVPGEGTNTPPPEVAGHIVQVLGKSISLTEDLVELQVNPYEYA